MSDYTIYLAGPIQHADDNGKTWREDVQERFLGLDYNDPLAKYDTVENVDVVSDGDVNPNAETEQIEVSELVESDLEMIDDADALLVGWDTVPSCGTPMEVRYAYERDYPIVVFYDGDEDISPWMEYHATTIVDTIEAAISNLYQELNGKAQTFTV